jgi:D-sedoheptulose 7-phosphate isomerase
MDFIQKALEQSQETLARFLSHESLIKQTEQAIEVFVSSIKSDGRILACGNGGSMCDSLHFAEELTGRFRKDRPPIAAHPMGDPGHMTCVANDFGFDEVFSRNVTAWGRSGDSLLAISTSGNSKNIIKAVEAAKARQMKSVGLLGKDGGALKDLVDVAIVVPSDVTDRIQEIHIKLIHIFIEGIERQVHPELY